jgi:hypothetical protein
MRENKKRKIPKPTDENGNESEGSGRKNKKFFILREAFRERHHEKLNYFPFSTSLFIALPSFLRLVFFISNLSHHLTRREM